MSGVRVVLGVGAAAYVVAGVAFANNLNDANSKLADGGKMLEVVFATSSQNINAAGFHVVQLPGQSAYTHYVRQIAEQHVMQNGGVTSFSNVTSLGAPFYCVPNFNTCS